MSNHWPPKVLTMVDSSAMLSPQPGLPRRHTPYRPLPGLWTLAAKARICSQVGCSGRLPPPPPPPPARHIVNELSPLNGAAYSLPLADRPARMGASRSSTSYPAYGLTSLRPPFLPQIGVSYMPMVITSNCPPCVAMSVVTRWRSAPSSSVPHLSLMSGWLFSNWGVSFCISIICRLLPVAMTSSVVLAACAAPAVHSAKHSAIRVLRYIIG